MKRLFSTLVLFSASIFLCIPGGVDPVQACRTTQPGVPFGVCALSGVLAKAAPLTCVSGGNCPVQVDLTVVCCPTGGGTCPVVTGAATTIDFLGPQPMNNIAATATVNNVPACSPAGKHNRFVVNVPIPGGTPPGRYVVRGTSTITFSDGRVLNVRGDVFACVVPSLELEIQPLTPFIYDAPGNQSAAVFEFTNHTATDMNLNLEATSNQIARRPGGGDESMGIYSISDPGDGDDFPIMFSPGYCDIPIPFDLPAFQQETIYDYLYLPAFSSAIVEIGVRSHHKCIDGSCSEVTIVAFDSAFGPEPLGCAATSVYTSSTVAPDCLSPTPFCEISQVIEGSTGGVTYYGGTAFDGGPDNRYEATLGGTWTFDSGVGDSMVPVPGSDPDKANGLYTLMEGWIGINLNRKSSDGPAPGGDWSNIVDITNFPIMTNCNCDLTDRVLVFEDLTQIGGHNSLQNNIAASPVIDLNAADIGRPGKFVEFKGYFDLPVLNYVLAQVRAEWYPDLNLRNGTIGVSPFTHTGYYYYTNSSGGVRCSAPGEIFRIDLSHIIPTDADEMRIGLGVINLCRFLAGCTGVSNASPYFDDVRFGVYGTQGDPPIMAALDQHLPQDAFPANGTMRADAPGRFDSGVLVPNRHPVPPTVAGLVLGDTLVLNGARGPSAEVRVQFAVTPGPDINGTGLADYFSSLTPEGMSRGQMWYSARMDTAEYQHVPQLGSWMTTFHELDPAFAGTDTEIDPSDPGGLYNDIFPDDLFTPGTRINLFFKTRFTAGGGWSLTPDTTGGNFYEWECLPSSMTAGDPGSWNCVLYVDHFSAPPRFSEPTPQPIIETALGAVLGTGSTNFEGTNWDRYDVRAPFARQASFGRPLGTEMGATVVQALGYETILWNSGNLGAFNLVREDADILIPWMTLVDFAGKSLYLSGDGIATSMTLEQSTDPSSFRLLSDVLGVDLTCNTLREGNCPPGTLPGNPALPCMGVDPVTGAVVASGVRIVDHQGQGNDCPESRSFDVLSAGTPRAGTSTPDERYDNSGLGGKTADYASISYDAGALFQARGVVDGLSVHLRRDVGTPCDLMTGGTTSVEERLTEVLTYFGQATPQTCQDQTAGIWIPDTPYDPVRTTRLAGFSPNPLAAGGTGHLYFTMASGGTASVTVFDIQGRKVRTVFGGMASQGPNRVSWDGSDDAGRAVPGGVYFLRLSTKTGDMFQKMIVVRGGK